MKNISFARSIVSVLALYFFFFSLAHSVHADVVPGKPKLVIESSVHNFGTVNQGERVVHEFTVRNTGNAELQLQRIVPACGCTATSSSANVVAPGATATVKVEFDTTGLSGEKLKTVRIFSNDPDDPATMLTIRGLVQPEVDVDPSRLVFPEIVRGEATQGATQDFTVKVRDGVQAKIQQISTYSRYITLKDVTGNERERLVQVTISPDVPPGELRDRIVVSLSGGKVSSINVPVLVTVRGQLQLKPSTLSFGVIEGKEKLVKKARLENQSQQPLKIKSITVDNPAVKVDFEVVKEGKIADITVTVDPSKVKTDLRATAKIVTDNTREGPLALGIYGILPPKL